MQLKEAYEQDLIPDLEKKDVKVLRLDGRRPVHENVSEVYRSIGYGKN